MDMEKSPCASSSRSASCVYLRNAASETSASRNRNTGSFRSCSYWPSVRPLAVTAKMCQSVVVGRRVPVLMCSRVELLEHVRHGLLAAQRVDLDDQRVRHLHPTAPTA